MKLSKKKRDKKNGRDEGHDRFDDFIPPDDDFGWY